MARRKAKKASTKKAISIRILDVAGLGITLATLLGGDVIPNARAGNLSGSVDNVVQNVKKNPVGLLMGIGLAAGGKALRKSNLSPRVGIPKVVSVSL